jgi:hypothetical protein
MPRPPWFNENRNRSYPFLHPTTGRKSGTSLRRLPNDAIVDCGFVFGALSGFAGEPTYLARVRRHGTRFFFDFACDATLLFGHYLTFEADLGDPLYRVQHSDSPEKHGDSLSDTICDEALWYGFVVFGDLAALAGLLADGHALSRADNDTTLEPAVLQSLDRSYVKSFALANADRTRVDAADDCPPIAWPAGDPKVRLWSRCLQGTILVRPGFNATLRQNTQSNTLTFGASVGAGEGQACDEVPTFTGETPPAGSTLLEGGPTCNEVLRSVNGIGGPVLKISGGNGVEIVPVTNQNKVIIDINGIGLAACPS